MGPGGFSKAPYGSFVGKPSGIPVIFPTNVGDLGQLDKGLPYQSVRTWLGPTLGWVQEVVRPETIYTVSTINLGPKDSVALINFAGVVTVNLPDVGAWVREPAYNMYTPFERAIWIKDISGVAMSNNIIVNPFGTQTIDGLISFTLAMNRGIIRLYPRNDLQGWYVG
jgi:hypothetical protein